MLEVVRFHLDAIKVNGEFTRLVDETITAHEGQIVEFHGWAIDNAVKTGAPGASVRVDDATLIFGRAGLARLDLVEKEGPESAYAGFIVPLPTWKLGPGLHRIRIILEMADGQYVTTNEIRLDLKSVGPRKTQIIVAGGPKTAGRHVASVLRRYFGIDQNPVFGFMPDGEHALTDDFLRPGLGSSFVFHCHPMARAGNIGNFSLLSIAAVVTWRNLGDIVVSLDDHFRLQPEEKWRHTYFYFDDRESYAAMPEQKRYEFIIRNGIPWYLQFYLMWRKAQQPHFMRYEWMAANEFDFFRYLIETLAGSVDEARLGELVAFGPTEESGVNVGIGGRSTALLGDKAKAMLEDLITEHVGDVDELLYELPWIVEKRGPVDIVATGPDAPAYLVRDGVKRLASNHWIRTHGLHRAGAGFISTGELAACREGADLY